MTISGGTDTVIGYAYEIGDLTKEGVKWDRTVSFWKKMVETVRPRIGAGMKGPRDLVVVGDSHIFIGGSHVSALDAMLRGAPIEFAPLTAYVAGGFSIALAKFPPNPNAAKLLLDFLTSEEGAVISDNANITYSMHPNPKVAARV